MKRTIAIILGGGQGTRLYPLTEFRSKPAVPLAGKYRLIDVPISNCLHSGINGIFVLTQFNSESLNRHITSAYRFDSFHNAFVDIIAAEQTVTSKDWFQGTADAVRKSLPHFNKLDVDHILILSGDQIYKMNYRKMLKSHVDAGADLTISVIPVREEEVSSFGIMKLKDNKIIDFVEKPKDPKIIKDFNSAEVVKKAFKNANQSKQYCASMGIYIFSRNALLEALDNDFADFGHQIIPHTIKTKKVNGYLFNGYWEDVGTIKSYLKANLDFTRFKPQFDFYNKQLYTNSRFLPPTKMSNCRLKNVMMADGCVIGNSKISKSIVGIRSIIGKNTIIENTIILGADYYANRSSGHDSNNKFGIGDNTIIENAIIDKNAYIGNNCKLINTSKLQEFDGGNYFIRDGIIVVPKHAVIPDNTII